MEIEGVIKYKTKSHTKEVQILPGDIEKINYWRTILFQVGLIGEYRDLKVGYGNISIRKKALQKEFIVSASQTGSKEFTSLEDYSLVKNFSLDTFEIDMSGPMPASSESLTHAAIFESNPKINFIIHVHHHSLWRNLLRLKTFPIVPKTITYGTKEMSQYFLKQLNSDFPQCHIMEGHEDGIIFFGEDPDLVGRQTLKIFQENAFL